MRPTQQLHDLGQSLWVDNITRGLLKDGPVRCYISEFSVTGNVDGWISLEVSPLLANDADGTIYAVAQLHRRAQRPKGKDKTGLAHDSSTGTLIPRYHWLKNGRS